MNLLAAVMPGLRDLRGPLASGYAWLFAMGLALFPVKDQALARAPDFSQFLIEIYQASAVLAFGLLSVVAYVVGLSDRGISNLLLRVAGGLWRRIYRVVGRHDNERLPWRLMTQIEGQVGPTPQVALARVGQTVAQALDDDNIAEEFPEYVLMEDVEALELKLSHDSADQFQQIDKLRAESEFRRGLVLPTIAISVVLAQQISVALYALVLIALYLFAISRIAERSANNLLWTAAYLGYAQPPLLSSLVESYARALPLLNRYVERESARLSEAYMGHEADAPFSDWASVDQFVRAPLYDAWLKVFLLRNGLDPDAIGRPYSGDEVDVSITGEVRSSTSETTV